MRQNVLDEVFKTEMSGDPPRHVLPDLPYDRTALAPQLSGEQLEFHHDKHHAAYVQKLNALIADTEFEGIPLQDIVMRSEGAIFNNAAQAWNHTFFWYCLSPKGQQADGPIARALDSQFGSIGQFKERFNEAALSLFGSGWVWLAKDEIGGLQIVQASNAGNPLRDQLHPVLTCDMWEHAYYIDYRNAKADYLEAFWNLVNWKFVNEQFEAAA